jgi:hypothetical protein
MGSSRSGRQARKPNHDRKRTQLEASANDTQEATDGASHDPAMAAADRRCSRR